MWQLSWCELACRYCVEEPEHGAAFLNGRASSFLAGWPFEFFST